MKPSARPHRVRMAVGIAALACGLLTCQIAAAAEDAAASPVATDSQSATDIFSRDTFSVLLDARLIAANGAPSFVDGGFGKTRFGGTASGGYKTQVLPIEADLVWQPRFTGALSANISTAWQRDHDKSFDLVEGYFNYLPEQKGSIGISARAGLMWPEISLEHSTGGAWTSVNTITPSAINSWVGEEVKVLGSEATVRASLGQQDFALTGGVFAANDTSGTLLSFRGWALDDEKATVSGKFPLPPLNAYISNIQAEDTRNTIELDNRAGFYGRLDWRPPAPFGVAVFYYDNRGDPHAFDPRDLQWGWRTRFWNVGVNADLTPNTKLLAQWMTGSTIMGFDTNGKPWVHTDYDSAYAMITRTFGDIAVSTRAEFFDTQEHGSRMPANNSENGYALTTAIRKPLNDHVDLLFEALSVRSRRGTRVDLEGLSSPIQGQGVFQMALRVKL